ncbi:MAG: hypothetical protein MW690_001653 [Methanophagales archaeon]|nr:hypothetical protein [Methanophagales archaeon]
MTSFDYSRSPCARKQPLSYRASEDFLLSAGIGLTKRLMNGTSPIRGILFRLIIFGQINADISGSHSALVFYGCVYPHDGRRPRQLFHPPLSHRPVP